MMSRCPEMSMSISSFFFVQELWSVAASFESNFHVNMIFDYIIIKMMKHLARLQFLIWFRKKLVNVGWYITINLWHLTHPQIDGIHQITTYQNCKYYSIICVRLIHVHFLQERSHCEKNLNNSSKMNTIMPQRNMMTRHF